MYILTNAADLSSETNALRELTAAELGAVAGGGPGPKERDRRRKLSPFSLEKEEKFEELSKKICEEDGEKFSCFMPKWLNS